MKTNRFRDAWWLSRLYRCFKLYDITRIDHFRGFDEYYSIPYGETIAVNGHWEKGPGIELFRQVERELGWHEVIAVDLGYITDSVRQLVRENGFPGMKVLEFAFDSRGSDSVSVYLPHNYPENCVAYTGTHDNETLVGWINSVTLEDRRAAQEYLCDERTPKKELHWPLIALVLRSAARLCVVPIQDYMGLDNRSRINKPSTVGTNWLWRLREGDLTPELQQRIRRMTILYRQAKESQAESTPKKRGTWN